VLEKCQVVRPPDTKHGSLDKTSTSEWVAESRNSHRRSEPELVKKKNTLRADGEGAVLP